MEVFIMKKFFEEKRDLLAGVFAILAFVSIICEMALGGFTKESLVSGIKDVSGVFIDVLVLLVAASVLIHKPINFKEKFNKAMDTLNEKYSPLLVQDTKEGVIRYNIASNPNALFSNPPKSPERIFELDESKPEKICFYINKSFFNKYGGTDFDGELIANQIALRLASVHDYKNYDIIPFKNNTNYGVKIDFKRILSTKDDVDMLVSLIDYTLFLFIARNQS